MTALSERALVAALWRMAASYPPLLAMLTRGPLLLPVGKTRLQLGYTNSAASPAHWRRPARGSVFIGEAVQAYTAKHPSHRLRAGASLALTYVVVNDFRNSFKELPSILPIIPAGGRLGVCIELPPLPLPPTPPPPHPLFFFFFFLLFFLFFTRRKQKALFLTEL